MTGFDWVNRVTGDGEDGLDALAADRVVDVAQVLSRVVHFGLFDDERAAHLQHVPGP